MEKEKGI